MWQLLMSEEETACITCPVRPVNAFESFLAASQSLECEKHKRGREAERETVRERETCTHGETPIEIKREVLLYRESGRDLNIETGVAYSRRQRKRA